MPHNALGPYGFTISFFQSHWPIIGEKDGKVMEEFRQSRSIPKALDAIFITLVPKKDKVEDMLMPANDQSNI